MAKTSACAKSLSVEEREQIVREGGKDSIVDREDLGGTWVRWLETRALFDAGPEDRVLCHRSGSRRGCSSATACTEGFHRPTSTTFAHSRTGLAAARSATSLPARSTASPRPSPGIESVFNPTAAGGGSDKATTEAMLTIGPRRISHRDRAVSAEDFEELALGSVATGGEGPLPGDDQSRASRRR